MIEMTIAEMVEQIEIFAYDRECICESGDSENCIACLIEDTFKEIEEGLETIIEIVSLEEGIDPMDL